MLHVVLPVVQVYYSQKYMLYLSQILNKQLYKNSSLYGKVIDLVAKEEDKIPTITQLVIKKSGKKIAISADGVVFHKNKWELQKDPEELRYSDKEFLLNEDLLDKQVIDVNGRRLVRVNDILLKENGKIKVDGIDISFSGILRRLGVNNLLTGRSIILPWNVIEAFDYQTGTIKIKLTQTTLNTFHPTEIADILEEAGTKERLGIIASLDAQKAASAIEEADEETQTAILEQVPQQTLERIVNRMHLSEIADIIRDINPFRSTQILTNLGTDKVKKLQGLLRFEDNVAGGLMDLSFVKLHASEKIKDVLEKFVSEHINPESIVVVDDDDRYIGVINARYFLTPIQDQKLSEIISHKLSVFQDTDFAEIFKIFTEYNLRILPVINKEQKVLGVIKIGTILTLVQEEEEKEDAV